MVVVCCVLCVVVVTSFTLTGREAKIGPAKKMADFSALITKNASLGRGDLGVAGKLNFLKKRRFFGLGIAGKLILSRIFFCKNLDFFYRYFGK